MCWRAAVAPESSRGWFSLSLPLWLEHGRRGFAPGRLVHHVCWRTACQPSSAGPEFPQRVKVRKKNLPKPVKILSDLWLGSVHSVHSVRCKQTASLQLDPSPFPVRAQGDRRSPSGPGYDLMNLSEGHVCLPATEQGPVPTAWHPCLGVILGSLWICFSSTPRQQANNSDLISPGGFVHQILNPWRRTLPVIMAE